MTLEKYSDELTDSSINTLTLQQAILWLRPASSQHLIYTAELKHINPMPFIYKSIDIVCNTAESVNPYNILNTK